MSLFSSRRASVVTAGCLGVLLSTVSNERECSDPRYERGVLRDGRPGPTQLPGTMAPHVAKAWLSRQRLDKDV